MNNEGFIKLNRKLIEWEWFDDDGMVKFFIYCLLKANWTDKKWKGILVKRGEFITSRKKLAQDLGKSEQTIRTYLNRLKSTNEITIRTTPRYTVIKVNNYNRYQDSNQQINQQLTNNQPTTNHNEEYIKNNKNNIYMRIEDEFEKLWNMYPNKKGKSVAYEHYTKHRTNGVKYQTIEKGLKRYVAHCKSIKNKRYIKYGSNWFSQKGWEDNYSSDKGMLRHDYDVEDLEKELLIASKK